MFRVAFSALGALSGSVMAFWSAKGGAGLSVVAAGVAAMSARSRPTVLVDLAGDQAAICGLASDPDVGIVDWMREADTLHPNTLERLGCDVAPGLVLIPRGASVTDIPDVESTAVPLGSGLAGLRGPVVVDAGTAQDAVSRGVVEEADATFFVTRPCYLALRRAVARRQLLDATHGAVVVDEKHRALGVDDVARVLGLPVRAVVPAHADIVRSVDAGTLVTRPPRSLTRALAALSRAFELGARASEKS